MAKFSYFIHKFGDRAYMWDSSFLESYRKRFGISLSDCKTEEDFIQWLKDEKVKLWDKRVKIKHNPYYIK